MIIEQELSSAVQSCIAYQCEVQLVTVSPRLVFPSSCYGEGLNKTLLMVWVFLCAEERDSKYNRHKAWM